MYLKQIEIHGFKSFANDTILNFEKGITGIVGPNGSGKSNIADAVRWVLGERSMKQLRGAETMDVIFSGTELRKAQGFAYVNLVIDNSDRKLPLSYDEVQVSRRLYRSGESEYKLNNVECRLKDINEVFYDTGIGKEGYSIIGQGQIDKILSNKPEDRRELFDEAVGIVKYKRRKIIAEKKLEEEKLNLSRVSDIINEIERQIGPLKKQAEAAKEYQGLKDDLLLYESNYFVREVDFEANNIAEINKKIEENKINLKEINEKKKAFNEKYIEIERLITSIDLQISELKDSITENTALSENIKGQINVLKEQINSEKTSNKGRIDRINSIHKTIDSLIEQIINDVKILNLLKNQIDFIKTSNTNLDDDNEQFDFDLSLINDAISKTKSIVTTIKPDLSSIFNEKSTISIFDSEDNFLNIDSRKKELDDVVQKIDKQNLEINKLNDILVDANNNLQNVDLKLMETQNVFHSKETKLDTLKNMLERYEGYGNAVKVILDNKSMFNGIKGVVADLIKTDKKYEIAIEIALGNTIQNIVTDNVETSKSIINYLKNNKLGRVTTLPLSSIIAKDSEIYVEAKSEKGVIGLATDIVKYDKEYDSLFEYLLKRCIIVDSYDNAKDIFKKYNSGIKLVTLDGELFNPGGAISGGAFKNSSSLLSRKREFDELSTEITEIKNGIDNLSKEKLRLSEVYDNTFNNIEKQKEILNNYLIEKNTINLNIINDMKLKYSNISNKAKFTSEDLEKLTMLLSQNNDEMKRFESDDAGFESSIKDKEDKIIDLENKISEIKASIEKSDEIIREKSSEKDKNLSNRKEYYDSKDSMNNELITLERESSELSSALEKSNLRIESITNQMFEEYNISYVNAKEKYKEELGSIDDIRLAVKAKRKVISDLGPINLNAIDEYAKIGDRYDLMTSQYEDIKKSEEMIEKIVDELDTNMKNQFDENFAKIKTQFEIVFKELFGGGKADLKLLETDELGVLDAGVAIVVQPPGKKLGNMMQLSGGEKALTAIALLFAIQNLKPSPFCLLDEIEAALDESNVDRYADYLKKLTTNTQFILITHRRGSMEKCDRLYGITMQEKGITALVSVDLVEDKLT